MVDACVNHSIRDLAKIRSGKINEEKDTYLSQRFDY